MSAISSFPAVLAGEWVKVRTLTSSWVSLGLTVALGPGLAQLVALSLRDYTPDASQPDFDPLTPGFYGLTLALLALVVYGVFAVGSEFSSKTIATSLVAVPARGSFYLGKFIAVIIPAAVVSVGTVFAAFFIAQAVLGPRGIAISEPGALEAVLGSALHLTLMCAFAMGIAAAVRSSVVALAVLLPVLFLGSQGLGNIPAIKDYAQFLPDQAGLVMLHVAPQDGSRFSHDFGPWTGIGIVALWAAASLLAGWLVTRRRDV